MKKKSIALIMSVVMLMGVTMGATLAWLTHTTEEVTNTFTNNANIEITLDEALVNDKGQPIKNNVVVTNPADADRVPENTYDLVPGSVYTKDPTVHVVTGSDDCYVYVKVAENKNAVGNKTIIQYSIGENWVEIKADTGIYIYCEDGVPHAVTAGENLDEILADNQITINSALTKTEISGLKDETTDNTPTLNFIAYALQAANITISNTTDAVTYWNQAFTPTV